MHSKINNDLRQFYSFKYFSYPCWCRSCFVFCLFFFSWGKKVCIWGPEKLRTPQALISLRSKKYICAEKLCHYVPVTKKRNKMASSWICPYWFLRQEQWQLLVVWSRVISVLFQSVWIVLCDWGNYRQEKRPWSLQDRKVFMVISPITSERFWGNSGCRAGVHIEGIGKKAAWSPDCAWCLCGS